jgi:hypothetical protein
MPTGAGRAIIPTPPHPTPPHPTPPHPTPPHPTPPHPTPPHPQIGSQPAKSTTVIAATNRAIDAWLAANGMTMADVAAREALADRIVGYSVGPGEARAGVRRVERQEQVSKP